ncbi:hypothetical protein MYX82_02805 [Acidobacteria bacterium AH-259-D05]|nr:hypothetical protein [Acidobacteria bacterium AH-259-D05]
MNQSKGSEVGDGMLEQLLTRLTEDATLLLASEEATKQGVILPILGRLGWDRDNIREVIPEYRVGSGRVDYCLRVGHKSAVFIEAKRTDQELERHQEQLLDYAFREGVELAALTNGVLWWLYLPLLEASWEQRKFFTIDIVQQGPKAAADHFISYLAKADVQSGDAVRRAKDLYRSREKERLTSATLPKAWRTLCEEPDEILLELLAEKVESLCGHQPTSEQVAQFLEQTIATQSQPAPMKTKPGPTPAPPDPTSQTHVFTFTRPRSFTLSSAIRARYRPLRRYWSGFVRPLPRGMAMSLNAFLSSRAESDITFLVIPEA